MDLLSNNVDASIVRVAPPNVHHPYVELCNFLSLDENFCHHPHKTARLEKILKNN